MARGYYNNSFWFMLQVRVRECLESHVVGLILFLLVNESIKFSNDWKSGYGFWNISNLPELNSRTHHFGSNYKYEYSNQQLKILYGWLRYQDNNKTGKQFLV